MTIKIKNRKAYRDYEIEEEYEAGIVLKGPEVKSVRQGKASLRQAYARVIDNEVWILSMHITPYDNKGYTDLNPRRRRKLLLHKHQIKRLRKKTEISGYTLVPLKLFINEKGKIKLIIGLAKGRREYDKKQYLIEKQMDRDKQRELREWQKKH